MRLLKKVLAVIILLFIGISFAYFLYLVESSAVKTTVSVRKDVALTVLGPPVIFGPYLVETVAPVVPASRHRSILPRPKFAPKDSGTTRYMRITSYCATGNSMSNGEMPYVGAAATLDRSIPFGTRISTPYGTFVVKDRIGYGSDLDIFTSSCQNASDFGRHYALVTIIR